MSFYFTEVCSCSAHRPVQELSRSFTCGVPAVMQELVLEATLSSQESRSPGDIVTYNPGKSWKRSQMAFGSLGDKQWFNRWANVDELGRRVKGSGLRKWRRGEDWRIWDVDSILSHQLQQGCMATAHRLSVVVLSLATTQLKLDAGTSISLYPRDTWGEKKNGLCLKAAIWDDGFRCCPSDISSSVESELELRAELALARVQVTSVSCRWNVAWFHTGLVPVHVCVCNHYCAPTGSVDSDHLTCPQNLQNTWKNISNLSWEGLRLRLAKPLALTPHTIPPGLKRTAKLRSSAAASPNPA